MREGECTLGALSVLLRLIYGGRRAQLHEARGGATTWACTNTCMSARLEKLQSTVTYGAVIKCRYGRRNLFIIIRIYFDLQILLFNLVQI